MRLTDDATARIKGTISERIGTSARVTLFGSRVDNGARDGDIDVLVEVSGPIERRVWAACGLEARLDLRPRRTQGGCRTGCARRSRAAHPSRGARRRGLAMSAIDARIERLRNLVRTVQRKSAKLIATNPPLFPCGIDARTLAALALDAQGSERIEAFAARFGRLRGTVGGRLLPARLGALAEPVRRAFDNLDRAERFGRIISATEWRSLRQLRNRLVLEYVDSVSHLAIGLLLAHEALPTLLGAAQQMTAEPVARGWLERHSQ